MALLHRISIGLLAILFVAAGINHFVNPNFYVGIMPPYVPAHLAMVYVSGVFELLGGIGFLVPKFRRAAGWGLIALLIGVFPVHFHMLANSEQFSSFSYWTLVARIPIQFLIMAWIVYAMKDSAKHQHDNA